MSTQTTESQRFSTTSTRPDFATSTQTSAQATRQHTTAKLTYRFGLSPRGESGRNQSRTASSSSRRSTGAQARRA